MFILSGTMSMLIVLYKYSPILMRRVVRQTSQSKLNL